MTTNNGICADCNKETELNAIGGTCVTCGSNSIVKPGASTALASKMNDIQVGRVRNDIDPPICEGCNDAALVFICTRASESLFNLCDHCMSSINEQYKNLIIAERSIVKEEKDGNL